MKKIFIDEKELIRLIDHDVLIIALGYKKIDDQLYKVIEYGIDDTGYLAYIPIDDFNQYRSLCEWKY